MLVGQAEEGEQEGGGRQVVMGGGEGRGRGGARGSQGEPAGQAADFISHQSIPVISSRPVEEPDDLVT